MFDCCTQWSESVKDQLECKVEETDKGIRIEVVPKDPAKKKAFQGMMKACKEFCSTENCSCC